MKWMFSFQRGYSLMLLSAFLSTFLLAGMPGMGNAHAATGKAIFMIEPTFFPHPNARPRPYFIYTSTPTSVIWDSITVRNVGTARGTVSLSAVDALTSQGSGVIFADPARPQHDVGSWIQLSSYEVTLNAGQSQNIPFSVHIPDRVRPGQHGGGIQISEPIEPLSSGNAGPYHTVFQLRRLEDLGVLVNLPGATTEKLRIQRIRYDAKDRYQRLLIGLANTGTQLLHPYGELQIIDTTGAVKQAIPLQMDTFVPQTSIEYPVYFHHQTLNPGTYTIRLSLHYEHQHQVTYTTQVLIPIPQLHDYSHTSRMVSDLVTNNPNIFQELTPLDYILGSPLLFLVLGALFFWGKTIHRLLTKRMKSKEHL